MKDQNSLAFIYYYTDSYFVKHFKTALFTLILDIIVLTEGASTVHVLCINIDYLLSKRFCEE